ncbi:Serine/threonine-protein kinase [Actinidia chinensis var. chinensis]|uniref:Serine/threonine-protein kinase n=1 Tax=Actinidia chinensis var. chinensis TaxID=1590841 RepID=A0A2R6Q0W6_ACTCC|nr:Serine/threonine-protein kinase [Actinidia chinensis var. chinensis]
MGCTQAKHSTNSPPWGLQKLKMENGYVIAKYPDARRSTGQSYSGIPRPEPRNSSAGNSGRLVGGGGEDGKLITREANKDSGGGNILKRMASLNLAGEEELVGQGIYSNVYKARDRNTGKIVALEKVRCDTSEPESVKFMAREIMILQKLDHPNIVKLEGLATSRMQVGVDLWSDGCLMAEMLAGRPSYLVEQLHRILKLCGAPSDEYWKRLKFFRTSPLTCDLSGLPVIYKEEVEPMQTVERRRHRNPKMRRRLRTLQESQKKDLTDVAMEQPKVDFGSAKEEAQKSAELNLQQGSSSTSTSSSIKHTIQEGTPLPSLFPNESSQKSMSPNFEAHPNATNNIKSLPPLPNA